MTCIVAVRNDKEVVVAADSASCDQYEHRTTVQPKVFRASWGPVIMGYTSSFRMGQILQHEIKVPMDPTDLLAARVDEFVQSVLVGAVRDAFKAHGFMGQYSGEDQNRERGGQFIVALVAQDGPHIYTVNSDFAAMEHADAVESVGSGNYFAKGAFSALEEVKPTLILESPEEVARLCLRSATHWVGGYVKAPYHVERLTMADLGAAGAAAKPSPGRSARARRAAGAAAGAVRRPQGGAGSQKSTGGSGGPSGGE